MFQQLSLKYLKTFNFQHLWRDWVPSPLVRRGEAWPNNLLGTPLESRNNPCGVNGEHP
jgi:hypothetical protein